MPVIQNNNATIYYEVHGSGFPILTFAPAGLLSTINVWSQPMAPIKPAVEWSSKYQVIVMDQRNAGGQSHAPLTATDGWDSYTSDHIAVLDHLKIERCHVYGQCIGGSFIFNLMKHHPQRVAAAIISQPIGRMGPFNPQRPARFNDWAANCLKEKASDAVLDAFYKNLYEPGFVYCADRAFVGSVKNPCLLLAGNDEAHPRAISDECNNLLQNVDYILEWKSGDPLVAAQKRCLEFLAQNTPK